MLFSCTVMNVSFVETTIEVMEGVGLVTFTLEKTMGALGPVAVQIFTTSRSAVGMPHAH